MNNKHDAEDRNEQSYDEFIHTVLHGNVPFIRAVLNTQTIRKLSSRESPSFSGYHPTTLPYVILDDYGDKKVELLDTFAAYFFLVFYRRMDWQNSHDDDHASLSFI